MKSNRCDRVARPGCCGHRGIVAVVLQSSLVAKFAGFGGRAPASRRFSVDAQDACEASLGMIRACCRRFQGSWRAPIQARCSHSFFAVIRSTADADTGGGLVVRSPTPWRHELGVGNLSLGSCLSCIAVPPAARANEPRPSTSVSLES